MSTLPEHLTLQWHPTKNVDLTPSDVSFGSRTVVWWQCHLGHEWKAAVRLQMKSAGCVYCSGVKAWPGYNDLATTHPKIAAEWHPTKNAGVTPEQVRSGSGKKIWWLCKFNHESTAVIKDKVKAKGKCPKCFRVRGGVNDVATMLPELVPEWHPTKNGNLVPSDIPHGSINRVWWKCSLGHEWEASPNHRSKGRGCAVCSGQRVLKGYNDLATTHKEYLKIWHPTKNSGLDPTDFTYGSNQVVWWFGECGHEWTAPIRMVATGKSACAVCAGKQVGIGFNDLASKSTSLAAQWHPTMNGSLTPFNVSQGSSRKVWWLCEKGHEWEATVHARVSGNGCWSCSRSGSKKEKELIKRLNSLGFQPKCNTRTVLKGKELDIFLPEHKLAIEFNGVFWHNEACKGITYHYDKWAACNEKGIKLIQIWEDEWDRNPDLVVRTITAALSRPATPVADGEPTLITAEQAASFLEENHLEGFVEGTSYIGFQSLNDLEAVMVLGKDNKPGFLRIKRYASNTPEPEVFQRMIAYAREVHDPAGFAHLSDNCKPADELYRSSGFKADREFPPDYMYVVNGVRESKTEYDVTRFKEDSALSYETGLDIIQLADLNNISRIWDAGKTRWINFTTTIRN